MDISLITDGSLSQQERDTLLCWLATQFVDSLQLPAAVAFVEKDNPTQLGEIIQQSFCWGGDAAVEVAQGLWGLDYRDNVEKDSEREEMLQELLRPFIRQRVVRDLC